MDSPTPTPQPRPCPHDCRKCTMQQQIYCTAQMTFNAFEQMNKMQEQMQAMEGKLTELDQKVNAIQSSEAELAIPMSDEPSPTPAPAPSVEIPPQSPSAE